MKLVPRIVAALCFFSTLSSCSTTDVIDGAAPKANSYVIIGASAARKDAKQPTWIGAYQWVGAYSHKVGSYRKTHIIHFPAGTSVVTLPSGRYALDHIDFGESIDSEYNSKYLGQHAYKFILKPGVISFVGRLELKNGDVAMVRDSALFKDACDKAPGIFSRLSIRDAFDPEGKDGFRIDCETMQVTPD